MGQWSPSGHRFAVSYLKIRTGGFPLLFRQICSCQDLASQARFTVLHCGIMCKKRASRLQARGSAHLMHFDCALLLMPKHMVTKYRAFWCGGIFKNGHTLNFVHLFCAGQSIELNGLPEAWHVKWHKTVCALSHLHRCDRSLKGVGVTSEAPGVCLYLQVSFFSCSLCLPLIRCLRLI